MSFKITDENREQACQDYKLELKRKNNSIRQERLNIELNKIKSKLIESIIEKAEIEIEVSEKALEAFVSLGEEGYIEENLLLYSDFCDDSWDIE